MAVPIWQPHSMRNECPRGEDCWGHRTMNTAGMERGGTAGKTWKSLSSYHENNESKFLALPLRPGWEWGPQPRGGRQWPEPQPAGSIESGWPKESILWTPFRGTVTGNLQFLPIDSFLYVLDFLLKAFIPSSIKRKCVRGTWFCGGQGRVRSADLPVPLLSPSFLPEIPPPASDQSSLAFLQKLCLLPVPLGRTPPKLSCLHTLTRVNSSELGRAGIILRTFL